MNHAQLLLTFEEHNLAIEARLHQLQEHNQYLRQVHAHLKQRSLQQRERSSRIITTLSGK
jgi:hypothetical protein